MDPEDLLLPPPTLALSVLISVFVGTNLRQRLNLHGRFENSITGSILYIVKLTDIGLVLQTAKFGSSPLLNREDTAVWLFSDMSMFHYIIMLYLFIIYCIYSN